MPGNYAAGIVTPEISSQAAAFDHIAVKSLLCRGATWRTSCGPLPVSVDTRS